MTTSDSAKALATSPRASFACWEMFRAFEGLASDFDAATPEWASASLVSASVPASATDGAPTCIESSGSTAAASTSYSTSMRSHASSAMASSSAATAATGWPTNTTRSMARTAWARVGAFFLRLGMSAAVMTARTPGRALAREVSMRLIRAWACGLRSSLACSMPLGLRSATYSVRPVTFSAPSARGIESPTPFTPRVVFITVAMASTPPSRRGGGCLRDRGDHLRVPGAPAQIAGDPEANLVLRGTTVLVQQGGRRHQHPGNAEATLRHAVTDERVLQRMERAVLTQA